MRKLSLFNYFFLSIQDKTKKIICPVCRSPLDEESLAVACSPEELEETEKAEEFVVPPSLKEQQLKMAELYERQKAKGGIIDLEHERNKYLVNPVSFPCICFGHCYTSFL